MKTLNELSAQHIMDSINTGLYVTGRDRKIVYWNKAAEKITGWSCQDAIGKGCFDDFLSHIDKDGRQLCGEEFCPLHRAMVTGKGSTVPVIVFANSKSGKRVPMRVSVAPIFDEKGEVIGGVETFQDLSLEYRDIQKVKQIQEQILINEASDDPRLTVTSYYAPCDIIGGDYYTVSRLSKDRYAFILADIVGHGMASALYTMYLNSLWQERRRLDANPQELMQALNKRLHRLTQGGTFAAALCGFLDLKEGTLQMVSAGGPAPIIYRAESNIYEKVPLKGMPLGCIEQPEFGEVSIEMRSGDHVVLFSDALFEIADTTGKMLGVDRLIDIFKECGWPKADVPFKEIERRLLVFSNLIRFKDDFTILDIVIHS
ncbi:MAG TPA: SpoIIE family protein phosphatase [Candidatus Omnitrophota bacterium]|nr:SpoIIE family protein phosphatase [Candidatus Omnitrophota bacterium]